ncbi:unnamed protein product [Clavelina lepadiformis]|uniref:C2H2-type domain-containing protein n=1 Tax=Clavelina lepadiformis TaxID=159417 RepID=A0ABP0FB59_CLALP
MIASSASNSREVLASMETTSHSAHSYLTQSIDMSDIPAQKDNFVAATTTSGQKQQMTYSSAPLPPSQHDWSHPISQTYNLLPNSSHMVTSHTSLLPSDPGVPVNSQAYPAPYSQNPALTQNATFNINNNNHLAYSQSSVPLAGGKPPYYDGSQPLSQSVPNATPQSDIWPHSAHYMNKPEAPPNAFHAPDPNVKTSAFENSENRGNGRVVRSFPCPKCAKVFKRGDHLKRHLLSVHDRDHPYQCGECPKGFASIDSLIKHNQSSHPDLITSGHLCVRCGIRFATLVEIENHANTLHEEQDIAYMRAINKSSKTFSCMICHKTVSSEKNLKRHIKKLHGESEGSKQLCYKCNTSFDSVSELQAHNTKVHTEEPTYKHDVNSANSAVNMQQAHHAKGNQQSQPQPVHPVIYNTEHQHHNFVQQCDPRQLSESSNFLPPNCQQPYISSTAVQKDANMNPYLFSEQQNLHNPYPCAPVQGQVTFNPTPSIVSSSHHDMKPHLVDAPILEASINNQQQPIESQISITDSLRTPIKEQEVTKQEKNPSPFLSEERSLDLNSSTCNKDSSSVSEAFSKAMKTLSDFSYDDYTLQVDAADYLPAAPSVFRSNSPLPNFHFPSSVQVAEPCATTVPVSYSITQPAQVSQSVFVVGPAVPFSEVASGHTQVQTSAASTDVAPPEIPTYKSQPGKPSSIVSSGSVECANLPLQARRGRPKKRRGTEDEEGEYGAQTMILKEFDDGITLKFNCTVCNQTYDGIDNLMHHVEGVHLSVNPNECCICNKRFAQAGNVKRHIRFVHLRERPFRCRECDSTFDRLCYLQRHMRSHIDSKVNSPDTAHLNPCNCPECGKRCLTAHHLRGHMQRKHFAKNKKQSGSLVKKYGHLFGGSEFQTMLGVKELDEFGRPINPTGKSKSRKTSRQMNGINSQIYKEKKEANCSNLLNEVGNIMVTSHQNPASNELQVNPEIQKPKFPTSLNNTSSMMAPRAYAVTNAVVKPTTKISKQKPHSHAGPSMGKKGNKSKKSQFRLYNNLGKFNKNKQRQLLQYKCQHCPSRRFPSLSLLKSHIAVEHHSTTHRHLCLLCGRSYSTRSLLVVHVKKSHEQKASVRARKNNSTVPPFGKITLHRKVDKSSPCQSISDKHAKMPLPGSFELKSDYQPQPYPSVSHIPTHSMLQT